MSAPSSTNNIHIKQENYLGVQSPINKTNSRSTLSSEALRKNRINRKLETYLLTEKVDVLSRQVALLQAENAVLKARAHQIPALEAKITQLEVHNRVLRNLHNKFPKPQ